MYLTRTPMTKIRTDNELSAMQLAQTIGNCWGKNDMAGFVSLFAPNALIVHPFFKEPISPKIAADVMNATVCGVTTYRGFVLQEGEGDGKSDVIEMYFDETGDIAQYKPSYIGRMAVQAEIKNHKFARLLVHGYDLINRYPSRVWPLERIEVGRPTTKELTERIAKAWGSNDMQTFVSLFAEDGLIMHPLFKAPITPEIAADVLNSAMRGISIPQEPKLITGDGSGEYDVFNMYVYETGQECGYSPDVMGIMHLTVRLINHRIKELYVHGYTPEPSYLLTRIPLLLESKVKEGEFVWVTDQQKEDVTIDLGEKQSNET